MPYQISGLPTPTPGTVKQLPVYHDGKNIFAGVDQGLEHIGGLSVAATWGATSIRHGRLNDGAGRETLAAYLSEAAMPLEKYTPSPTVRVIGGASPSDVRRVTAAVGLVNAALPASARVSMGLPLADFSLLDTVNSEGRRFVSGEELGGTIHIEFLPCSAYYNCGTSGGTAWNHPSGDGSIDNSYIQMNRGAPALGDERNAITLLAHEMLHALGLGHVSAQFDTILEATNAIYHTSQNDQQPTSILYPVDREALRALYGRLEIGDGPTDFGPWNSTSTHVVGVGEDAAFGVAFRNGYAEPWAYGIQPGMDLADNPELSGTATWTGTLLGFTPNVEAVAGDAQLGVNLGTMKGAADFTALESWQSGMAPGEAGSGVQWGDGDLGYAVDVRGNTFVNTGGDDGVLTGIFTGASHEGMAGTLERDDLTAAFGGSR